MAATPPPSARRYYAASALLASRTASEALAARPRGLRAAWIALITGQVRQAQVASEAVDAMLMQQEIDRAAEALLNSAAFTTEATRFEAMVEQAKTDAEFVRIVESVTQDAARAAQSVSVASRNHISYVRHLNLPSCSRCAVLAGRVYRWSTGFRRHPGCDCVMIPTTVANDALTYDPVELARDGQVTDLSKADRQAILDGADVGKVVNVRRRAAGLKESGLVLLRDGRMTPEAIYRVADGDRTRALDLLAKHGYVR